MLIESNSTCDAPYAKYDWRTAALGAEIGLHHRIVRPLATGGMSQVFLAEHVRDGSYAAAKLNAPGNEIPNDMFDQEAALLARCRHPNIVSPLDKRSSAFTNAVRPACSRRFHLEMRGMPSTPITRVLASVLAGDVQRGNAALARLRGICAKGARACAR
ncbi:MAG TPA: hypothetical protein VFN67_29080 [Polyangiales bacterium]|nr:hypothetical protein [Polyangiales bacterium]